MTHGAHATMQSSTPYQNPIEQNTANQHVLLETFTLVDSAHIEALKLDILVCKHKVTGAMHYHLAHDSKENAFLVAFRTQPMDSRGTAHILEHTALCGSEKYPVRDPFFTMLKRSLQTFMNAFTASDWTAYPFATQNAQDFDNLLSVYLDAAFFPKLHELDFAQEGIRVEIDDDGKATFKGIVFNEMKGAMSGEIEQLYHSMAKHLHPDTTYHHNSGGDPSEIPKLTHSDLIAFHAAHYHPSNAIFMTFGDRPLTEIQTQLEHAVLSHFEQGKKYASVAETRLSQPIEVVETYAVDTLAPKQTHHALGWLLPSMTDTRMRLAMRMVEGVLLEHAGSPLRKLLESSKLGQAPSPLLGLDDNHYEMAFYAGLRGCEQDSAEAIEKSILDLLNEVAKGPIAQNDIDMVLHQIELNERHISGDGMPYGLNLMLEGLSAAIHDGNALDVWQIKPHLDWLKIQLKDEMWLPNLIKTQLIDNPHRVRLSLVADDKLSAQIAETEQQKLTEIDKQLAQNDTQRKNIIVQTKALAARQAEIDDVSLLPKVGLEDIPTTLKLPEGKDTNIELLGKPANLTTFSAGTNGLYYTQLLVELPEHILANPLLPIYTGLLAELGAGNMTHDAFAAAQAMHTGGISIKLSKRTALDDKDAFNSYLVFGTRALVSKPEAFSLLKTCWLDARFDEHERIIELLSQKQARWQSQLAGSGHAYAMQTACSSMSKLSSISYHNHGLPALVKLKSLVANLHDADHAGKTVEKLIADLNQLHDQLTNLPLQSVLVAEDAEIQKLTETLQATWQAQGEKPEQPEALNNFTHNSVYSPAQDSAQDSESIAQAAHKDTAWLVATNVYHNAMSFSAVPAGHKDASALMILAPYLRNNFLHRSIREQGGAYGGGASYDATACAFKFYSYRDPRCAQSFADFNASIDWLLESPQEAHWLEEAIMGVIASVDKPGSPAGEAIKTYFAELHGRTANWQQSMRASLLTVTLEDLKRVAQTYLVDKPAVRACLAPFDKADSLKEMGFVVEKMPA